ncbi:MAG: tRNA pseudouridine(38-40) synthase TruA [Lachnospiraceae bacterium]|nr:tRNA pseudouridine(38-40) synthase TruA [Lachnospiraceae bacterium]
MKRNYRFILSYDGTRYYGFERQPNTDMTIQGKVETVLSRMLLNEREEDEETGASSSGELPEVKIIGAGRTDAGVHARAMTVNAFLDTKRNESEILSYVNQYLPSDISVTDVKKVSDRFHSRYNALGKTYRYTCWFGASKPVFDRKYVTILPERPDVTAMRAAAECLTGTHDFKSFCGNTHMKKSTVRHLDNIRIEESGSYIRFYFHGNGFLQNMVRILTGTLLEVGFGQIPPEDMKGILEGCDRKLSGHTAPAAGLCLMKIDY